MSVIRLNHLCNFSQNGLNKKPLTWNERIESFVTDPLLESTRISFISNLFKWSIFLGDFSSHGKSFNPTIKSTLNKLSDYSNVLSFWNIPNTFLNLIGKIKRVFSCKVISHPQSELKLKDYCDAVAKTADAVSSLAGTVSGTIFRTPLQFEMFYNPDLINLPKNSFERSICSYVSSSFKAISLTSKIISGKDKRWLYIVDFILLISKVTIVALVMINLPMHAAIPLCLATVSLGWGIYKILKSTN